MDVTMPQLGETVTEGTITRWLKQVGDHVDADEPLFEVSTDKVDSEVPAPVSGTVTEILVEEGETVGVGTRLAVVGDAAAAASAPAPVAVSEPEPQPEPQPEPVAVSEPAPEPEPEPQVVPEAPTQPEPQAEPQVAAPIAFSAEPAVAAPSAPNSVGPTGRPLPFRRWDRDRGRQLRLGLRLGLGGRLGDDLRLGLRQGSTATGSGCGSGCGSGLRHRAERHGGSMADNGEARRPRSRPPRRGSRDRSARGGFGASESTLSVETSNRAGRRRRDHRPASATG